MNRYLKLIVLAMGHLLIDMVGIYIIHYQYNHLALEHIALFFVVYNILAFGLQPIVGYYADKNAWYKHYVLLAPVLSVLSLILFDFGLLPIFIMTIANAMYHVGGGALSVDLFPRQAMPTGVFVAPGALGVFIGYVLALGEKEVQYFIILGLIIFFVTVYLILKEDALDHPYQPIHPSFITIIGLVLTVIAVRGFVGTTLVLLWNTSLVNKLYLVIGVFLGKFLGGICGDWFGFKAIGVGGLVLSLPLLLIGQEVMIFGLLGAFLFNLTMAITLLIIIDSLGKYKGFAFGLTTLTLVIFFLPAQLGFQLPGGFAYYGIMIVVVFIAIIALYKAIEIYQIEERKD